MNRAYSRALWLERLRSKRLFWRGARNPSVKGSLPSANDDLRRALSPLSVEDPRNSRMRVATPSAVCGRSGLMLIASANKERGRGSAAPAVCLSSSFSRNEKRAVRSRERRRRSRNCLVRRRVISHRQELNKRRYMIFNKRRKELCGSSKANVTRDRELRYLLRRT